MPLTEVLRLLCTVDWEDSEVDTTDDALSMMVESPTIMPVVEDDELVEEANGSSEVVVGWIGTAGSLPVLPTTSDAADEGVDAVVVGMIDVGRPLVEPIRKATEGDKVLVGDSTGADRLEAEVGSTTVSGSPPVDAMPSEEAVVG